jgi:hypothetical protein
VGNGGLVFGSVVAGVLVGASVVLLVGERDASRHGPMAQAATVGAPVKGSVDSVSPRAAEVSGDLRTRRSSDRVSPAVDDAERVPEVDEREEERREWNEKLEEFERETRSPTWAGRAEERIAERLPVVAQSSGARLVSIDCRESRCRVELAWEGEGAGNNTAENSMDVLHRSHEAMNCARSIRLSDDRTTSDLIFDCSAAPDAAVTEDVER